MTQGFLSIDDALTLRAPAATAARGGGGEEKRWSS